MMNKDGIILFAKPKGPTSFNAISAIKRALDTTKVGHTGTLDSFAQGLLVVCTGRLTKLAGNIIEFDKSYSAVIKFGEETDTLEYTGNVIKTSALPSLKNLEEAVKAFTGKIMQTPPVFSAIHINGKRASDLIRQGQEVQMESREVQIHSADIKETKLSADGLVEYALIDFNVSKGTYIRCLARDIAQKAGSTGHLLGLYRTKVGNFNIEDSAGFSLLEPFTIDSVIKNRDIDVDSRTIDLTDEIINKMKTFDEEAARLCGFSIIHLNSLQADDDFRNGRPLRSKNFDTNLYSIPENTMLAVYTSENDFAGLIEKNQEKRIKYKMVIN